MMAENDQAQQNQPQFGIQSIYVKDISFEMPLGPELFTKPWQPKFNVELNTASKKFQDNSYEVVLSITVTITLEEKTAALIEIQQAGLFLASGMDDETLRRSLGIVSPTALFPYAREAIDNLCLRGGIPAVKLQPVNFEMLYVKAMEEARSKQAGQPTEAH